MKTVSSLVQALEENLEFNCFIVNASAGGKKQGLTDMGHSGQMPILILGSKKIPIFNVSSVKMQLSNTCDKDMS